MQTSIALLISLTLVTVVSGQSINQPTSPNGAYILQARPDGTWVISDNKGTTLNAVTPRLPRYDKIVTTWSPDSEKVAILAMTLKNSDVYVLGTKNTYTIPRPSTAALKATTLAHTDFPYNPQSYSFADKGAVSVAWANAQQLQLRTEFVANLSDSSLGVQDHWKFIIAYGYGLGDEEAATNLQIVKTRRE
jgi:hypothetical protein